MSDNQEDIDQGGKVSPSRDKAKIDAKIHQFENGEREKVKTKRVNSLLYHYCRLALTTADVYK